MQSHFALNENQAILVFEHDLTGPLLQTPRLLMRSSSLSLSSIKEVSGAASSTGDGGGGVAVEWKGGSAIWNTGAYPVRLYQ